VSVFCPLPFYFWDGLKGQANGDSQKVAGVSIFRFKHNNGRKCNFTSICGGKTKISLLFHVNLDIHFLLLSIISNFSQVPMRLLDIFLIDLILPAAL
jgi:hypothetical protein